MGEGLSKISVVVPAFNEEKYIEGTVDALLKQDYSNYEIVIVPNGCTDGTGKVLQKYIKHKHVKIKSLKEAKVSKARNAGAAISDGETLVFLDADVRVKEDFLSAVMQHLSEEHSVASTLFTPDIKRQRYLLYKHFKNAVHQSKLYRGSAGSIICRKKEFDKLGGFDESLVVKEDSDLIKRLCAYGKYTCIPHEVEVSMRRLEKWGSLSTGAFFVREWVKKKLGFKLTDRYEEAR